LSTISGLIFILRCRRISPAWLRLHTYLRRMELKAVVKLVLCGIAAPAVSSRASREWPSPGIPGRMRRTGPSMWLLLSSIF
jgi:hypothetical protein